LKYHNHLVINANISMLLISGIMYIVVNDMRILNVIIITLFWGSLYPGIPYSIVSITNGHGESHKKNIAIMLCLFCKLLSFEKATSDMAAEILIYAAYIMTVLYVGEIMYSKYRIYIIPEKTSNTREP